MTTMGYTGTMITFLSITAFSVGMNLWYLVTVLRCAAVRRSGTRVSGVVTGNATKRAGKVGVWLVPIVRYTLDGREYEARLVNYTSDNGLPVNTTVRVAVAAGRPDRPVAVDLSSWPAVFWYLLPLGVGVCGTACVGIR